MKQVSYTEYKEELRSFLRKCGEWKCTIGGVLENGSYGKVYYSTEDALNFWEMHEPVTEICEAVGTVKGVRVTLKQEVELVRVEFWSTLDEETKCYYERA